MTNDNSLAPDPLVETVARGLAEAIRGRVDALKRADELASTIARVRALAESWRYKGEYGFGAWQEGHGPDLEGEIRHDLAVTLLAALDATEETP